MEVSVKSDGNHFIVSCPQTMEWRARVDLVEALKSASCGKEIGGVIIDLSGVDFINSAGLGAIFSLRKYAKENGAETIIARPSVSIQRLLDTVNLPSLIPVRSSLDEARVHLESSAKDSSKSGSR